MSVDPLKLFKEDLHSESMSVRVECMKKLKRVALALGPDRCVDDLMPVLRSWSQNAVEDELLSILASAMDAEFLDIIGGSKNSKSILEILQMLCATEETVVRDRATNSVNEMVSSSLSLRDVEGVIFPMFKSLSNAEWFTPRVSACSIVSALYTGCEDDDIKEKIRSIFRVLCVDETPMVRRAAARVLGDFALALKDPAVVTSEALPAFKSLIGDESEGVQLFAATSMARFAKILDADVCEDDLIPVLRTLASSKSWRKREVVAKDVNSVGVGIGRVSAEKHLVKILGALLQDHEREVRSVAISQLPGFCSLVGIDVFKKDLLTTTLNLFDDPNPQIQSAMAEVAVALLPELPKEMCNPVLHIMQTESTDCKIKVRIIERICEFGDALGMLELRETFVPEILKLLSEDNQWRTRREIVRQVPELSSALGERFFKSKLVGPLIGRLEDDSEAVRISAIDTIVVMADRLDGGSDWLMNEILPDIKNRYDKAKTHYDRMVAMRIIQRICDARFVDAARFMFPCWADACENRVPNLRILAAQIFATIIPLVREDDRKIAQQKLESLLEDSDGDVSYVAKYASIAAFPKEGKETDSVGRLYSTESAAAEKKSESTKSSNGED